MKLLFIVGPTASGKSDLAMQVALAHNGEIICADSQTVRRGMDIGTAKPSKDDQVKVPHHMLDIIEPYDRFTVAEFKQRAEVAIADIQSRGKLPIIVGGTGLYIDALLYDFQFRGQNTSEYSREQLESMRAAELQNIIAQKGYTIPNNAQNPRHLVRTIESGGAAVQGDSLYNKGVRERAIVVGLDPGRDTLFARIESRVDVMLKAGLLEEYANLIERYGYPQQGFDATTYRTIDQNQGSLSTELREKLIIADRQYSKKQRTWLKRNKSIHWFDDPELACNFLSQSLLQ